MADIWHNIVIVIWLVVLEGLLSADNAIVLAVIVRRLPDEAQRKRALRYGIFGAFAFRALAVVLAVYLVRFKTFQLAGGLYLVYVAVSALWGSGRKEEAGDRAEGVGFWRVVLLVELADMAFSIDSILAAVGLSTKYWVILTGGILGIITMRYVAGLVIIWMDRFPALERTGFMLVGIIGLKLCLTGLGVPVPHWALYLAMALTAAPALFIGRKRERG